MKIVLKPYISSRSGDVVWEISMHREWFERPKIFNTFVRHIRKNCSGWEYKESDWFAQALEKDVADITQLQAFIAEVSKRYLDIRSQFRKLPQRQVIRVR